MAFENDPEGRLMAVRYAGLDFDKPREVRIEPFCEYGSSDWGATEFLAIITKAIEEIPADRRDSAIVELEGGYEESTKLVISYQGLENTKAVADRILRCEQYVAEKRAAERATYEALKKKFG